MFINYSTLQLHLFITKDILIFLSFCHFLNFTLFLKKNYYFIPFHLNKDKLNYFINGNYRNSESNIRLILKWRDVDLNQGNRWNIHIIQLNIRLYLYYSYIVRLTINLKHSTLTLYTL